MAQRQRVGFQIQRLGVRIPLGSYFYFLPISIKVMPEVGFEPTRTYAHLNLSQAP